MQDTEVFLGLAGIAGVFVGFGALIAVRSGGTGDAFEVTYVRTTVWLGMLTVIAALAPVTLRRYGISDHQVWVVSGLLVLACHSVMFAIGMRTPEMKAADAQLPPRQRALEGLVTLLMGVVLILAMAVIVLGVAPDLEAALYTTIVVLILMGAGYSLLELVWSQRRPAASP